MQCLLYHLHLSGLRDYLLIAPSLGSVTPFALLLAARPLPLKGSEIPRTMAPCRLLCALTTFISRQYGKMLLKNLTTYLLVPKRQKQLLLLTLRLRFVTMSLRLCCGIYQDRVLVA